MEPMNCKECHNPPRKRKIVKDGRELMVFYCPICSKESEPSWSRAGAVISWNRENI